MTQMRAMEFTDTLTLRLATRPLPEPQSGELLIQVSAAGATPTEKLWYTTTHKADGTARVNAIPGHEFSGTVANAGAGVTGFRVGDSVFGLNDWFAEGATAEFCIAKPSALSLKPKSMSDAEAAAAPISVLTAYQGLHLHAKLQKEDRLLIHGGAGAVGLCAVQLAKRAGAYVVATASKANVDLLKQLGANEAIDYRERRFEEAGRFDVIFDTVGGATLDRSWSVLKDGGRLVTIAADSESNSDPRVKNAFFIVEQNGAQLAELAKLLGSGELISFVKAELQMEEADRAYNGPVVGRPGKIVIRTRSRPGHD
jgi:NADPH:quinone reductase-like Zn-dependent oxidoreductase